MSIDRVVTPITFVRTIANRYAFDCIRGKLVTFMNV